MKLTKLMNLLAEGKAKYDMNFISGGFSNGIEIKYDPNASPNTISIKVSIYGGGTPTMTAFEVPQELAQNPEFIKSVKSQLSTAMIRLLRKLDQSAMNYTKLIIQKNVSQFQGGGSKQKEEPAAPQQPQAPAPPQKQAPQKQAPQRPTESVNPTKSKSRLQEVTYPTDLKMGSVILGKGFTALKGIENDKYYKVIGIDDYSATLTSCDANGNVKGSKKIRHYLSSLDGCIRTAKRGDSNGVIVVKEVRYKNENMLKEAISTDEYIKDIASLLNMNPKSIHSFITSNKLNAAKLWSDLGRKKLNRLDFITAVVGNPGNEIQRGIIKNYTESDL